MLIAFDVLDLAAERKPLASSRAVEGETLGQSVTQRRRCASPSSAPVRRRALPWPAASARRGLDPLVLDRGRRPARTGSSAPVHVRALPRLRRARATPASTTPSAPMASGRSPPAADGDAGRPGRASFSAASMRDPRRRRPRACTVHEVTATSCATATASPGCACATRRGEERDAPADLVVACDGVRSPPAGDGRHRRRASTHARGRAPLVHQPDALIDRSFALALPGRRAPGGPARLARPARPGGGGHRPLRAGRAPSRPAPDAFRAAFARGCCPPQAPARRGPHLRRPARLPRGRRRSAAERWWVPGLS